MTLKAAQATSDLIKSRFTVLALFTGFLALMVSGRAAYIQVIGDSRLSAASKKQFQSKLLIRPRRGSILDRNGEPLAVNVEIRSLAANPSKLAKLGKLENKKSLARLLAKALDIPQSKLVQRLGQETKREFAWIKRHLKESDLARLTQYGIIDSSGELIDGLWMVKESKRIYPHGELAAHVLGSVNLDSEGLEGIELQANGNLQGTVVSVAAIRDALGRPTFMDATAIKDVRDGQNISLTIDASLQFSVEQELKAMVNKSGARSGTAMVMNAVTGEILAMANEPSFNPNHPGAPVSHRRNRAITDGYEPGSTLKSVILASGLSRGMKLSDSFWGERGSYTLQKHTITEAETHERWEWINLKQMLQVSSNIVAAKLALKIGSEPVVAALKLFGFGEKTGTGFPGEISGMLPGTKKKLSPLSLANVGFGQGILVSPLQMIRAYAAFANGGWLVQPTLFKTPLKATDTAVPVRIMSEKVSRSMVDALVSATDDKGTGVKARLDGYQVAGKTGTAQVVEPGTGKYSRSRYVASFIGFPVGVEPNLVIFAAVDDPKGIYYASERAAPLFRSILNAAVSRFSLPSRLPAASPTPSLMPVITQREPVPSAKDETLNDRLTWSLAKVMSPGAQEPQARMPDLAGLSVREAIRVLAGHDFRLEIRGAGVVKHQSPEPGRPIADRASVKLSLSEP